MNEKHVGSDFDDFLREEGLLEEVEAVAAKRVLAYQISEAMKEQDLSKAGTSCASTRGHCRLAGKISCQNRRHRSTVRRLT